MENKRGITLIALVVTIIVLIILAGVSISLILGDNGIITKAKEGKEDYTKAKLKEDLELKIVELETEGIAGEKGFKRKDLEKLSEIGAIVENTGIPAIGEYKGYDFTVDENNEVTIGEKATGERPTITLTKNTEEMVEVVTITVVATTTDGTITLIRKPDGTTTTETNFSYDVTRNGEYTFVAEGSNGRKGSATIEINNTRVALPIITSEFDWPTLTPQGFVLDGTGSIEFDSREGLENYYSIDGGTTWELYTGPFNLVKSSVIYAKSMKDGEVVAEASQNVTLPTNSLSPEAYDGETSTAGTRIYNNQVQTFRVTEDTWGMTLEFYGYAKYWGGRSNIWWSDQNRTTDVTIETISGPISEAIWFSPRFSIPEGTYWITMDFRSSGGYFAQIYEVRLITE